MAVRLRNLKGVGRIYQQTFIDKLTGNSKYQGDFGEKFLEQSLQFHGFKLGIDYTKQKKEEVLNIEDVTGRHGC